MKKRIYNFMLNISERQMKIISLSAAALLIISILINLDNKIGLELSFLIMTPLIWMGGCFLPLWYYVRAQSLKAVRTVFHKTLISLSVVFMILLFLFPIFCYCMAKYYEIQADYYRSLLHK